MTDLSHIFSKLSDAILPVQHTLNRLGEISNEIQTTTQLIIPESLQKPLFSPEALIRLKRGQKWVIACTEAIGKGGWTLQLWMDYPDISNLFKKTRAQPKEMDSYFLSFYDSKEGGTELEKIFTRIESSVKLSRWNPLLLECIDAFISFVYRRY